MASILLAGSNTQQKQVVLSFCKSQNITIKEIDGLAHLSQLSQETELDLIIICCQKREWEIPISSLSLPVLLILSPLELDLFPLTEMHGDFEILISPFTREEFIARMQLLKGRKKKTRDFMRMSILHQLEEVIYSATLLGELVYLNPSARKKYGTSLEELIQRRLGFLCNILQETYYNRSEYKLKTAEGLFFLEEKTYLVKDDQGQALRIDGIVSDITEMKYTEQALRDGEAKMRSIITVIPDTLIHFNRQGMIKDIWAQEDGYTPFPAHLVKKGVFDFLPEETANRLLDHISGAIHEKVLKSLEFHLDQSGQLFTFEARIVASGRDEVVAIIRDITEIRRAEESLRRFRVAMDSSFDLIFLMDYDTGAFLDVNNTACQILGYPREELLSLNLLDIQPSLSSKNRGHLFSSLQDGGKKKDQKTWYQKKDGSSLPVEVSLKYLEINSRSLVMASARDITMRIQLRKERDRLFNLSLDMMCVLDYKGVFRQVNPSWERIVGWKEEELLNSSLFAYIHPQEIQETREKFHALSQGIPVKNLESRYHCRDGTYRWLSFSLFPVKDEQIIVSVVRDVTGKKEDQERLASYAEEMKVKNQQLMEVKNSLKDNIAKAGEMHQRFLPRSLPQIPGLTIGTYYQPAQRVGGDFYNILSLPNHLLIYMADVSGHGLDGAMLTIFLRENINHYMTFHQGRQLQPREMLHHLANMFFKEDFPEDYFICLSLFLLDLKNWHVTYCNAGNHIPPYLVDGGGCIRPLNVSGFPISQVLHPHMLKYQQLRIPFSYEDTLFITTDGLVEQFRGDDYYGEERMLQMIKENYHQPVQGLIDAVNRDFFSFNGRLQADDDISFLVLKRSKE